MTLFATVFGTFREADKILIMAFFVLLRGARCFAYGPGEELATNSGSARILPSPRYYRYYTTDSQISRRQNRQFCTAAVGSGGSAPFRGIGSVCDMDASAQIF
jgi:hypothetical protein